MLMKHDTDRFDGSRRPLLTGGVLAALFVLITVFSALALPQTAQAQAVVCTSAVLCDTCCAGVVCPYHAETQLIIIDEHDHLREEVLGVSAGILPFFEVPEPPEGFFRLQWHERFLILDFFREHILPALMMMTEQLVTVMMEQMLIVGTFFDAKQQLDTQLVFQELMAQAHKDYHPSFSMCEIGTNTRSLGTANLKGDLTIRALNKQQLDRQLGTGASVGAGGQYDRVTPDIAVSPTPFNRLGYFYRFTCDDNDLNKVLGRGDTGLFMCGDAPPGEGWVNRDIDWNNTVMSPRTINVDYSLGGASDGPRLFQMSNYLYGHDVFSRPDGTMLEDEENHDNYLDSRSVVAKRNVAQNSFSSIVGLKARGTNRFENPEFSSENTSQFMNYFMIELGFPLDDPIAYHRYMFHKHEERAEAALDEEQDQISYYGQMEMLAKKIYQRPEFYTQLYDKPANVKRKSAAMQAIKLMLERDIFDSQLRSEMLMSMILELKVVEEQQNIESMLGLLGEQVRN